MKYEQLLNKAIEATENAYVPYSKFRVGAALKLKDGNIITGVNIENASFGLTNCAERTALFTAYAKGYRKEDIEAIAIVADTENPVSPCGACRQVMSELLADECDVILGNMQKQSHLTNVNELLPYNFKSSDMK